MFLKNNIDSKHWRLKKKPPMLKKFFQKTSKILRFFNFEIKKFFFKKRPKF